MMSVTLADYLDHWPGGLTFQLFVIALGIGSLVVIVLTILGLRRCLWGRKPPIDDDLTALRKELEGLAPAQKVEALIEKISGAATKEEVEKLRLMLDGFVDQAQMDRRIGAWSTK